MPQPFFCAAELFAAVIFVAAYTAEQYVPKYKIATISALSGIAATATVVLTAAAKEQ